MSCHGSSQLKPTVSSASCPRIRQRTDQPPAEAGHPKSIDFPGFRVAALLAKARIVARVARNDSQRSGKAVVDLAHTADRLLRR